VAAEELVLEIRALERAGTTHDALSRSWGLTDRAANSATVMAITRLLAHTSPWWTTRTALRRFSKVALLGRIPRTPVFRASTAHRSCPSAPARMTRGRTPFRRSSRQISRAPAVCASTRRIWGTLLRSISRMGGAVISPTTTNERSALRRRRRPDRKRALSLRSAMRIVVDAMGEAGARKDALQGGPAASPQRAWNGSIGELGGAGKRVEGASRTTGAKVAPTPPRLSGPDATARFGAGVDRAQARDHGP
jgi:hypothetical protein